MRREQSIVDLQKLIRQFADDRDWEQYHSPKNLVMALSGEVGELNDIFQWLSEGESYLKGKVLQHASEEMGDILIYLIRLADRLGLDLLECGYSKLQINENKYPVDKVKGSSKKYNEYQ